MNFKRILVSGGFGYIGSYLVNHLLNQGYQVGVLARSVPAHFSELAKLVDVYIADIVKPIECVPQKKYDIFIHLAAANDIDSRNAEAAIAGTVLGTRNCLEFCRSNGLKRFVYFSTFQVYGADTGQVDENTPLNPRNEYAITHVFAEEYVKMYQRNFGLEYMILRPVNLYGPPLHRNVDRWSLVPNCFCESAYARQKIVLRSSGKQIKEFISLEDLCGITTLLCQNFAERKNRVFNAAKGAPISILEIAKSTKQVYEQIFDKQCELQIESNEPAHSEILMVATDRIKELGYAYSVEHSLESDLEEIFHLLAKE